MPIGEQPLEDFATIEQSGLTLRLPKAAAGCEQDEEWFEYRGPSSHGRWRRLRIHDYREIFRVPQLYEALVYNALKCSSPSRITRMLDAVLADWPDEPSDLRVLDLGAGNGIVAKHLRAIGVEHVIGVDLLEEAAMATERDRPEVYDDYLVADLCNLTTEQTSRLDGAGCNCLITVAALGFGDIPPRAFARAVQAIETPGWIAMAIKEDFLTNHDPSGFAHLIQALISSGSIEVHAKHRYRHRLSMAGEELYYVGVIGRKLADVPEDLLRAAEEA